MASSPQLPNAALEETPKKDDVPHGSGSTGSDGSKARKVLFPKAIASRSFNEEELKWKPLPPIDSTKNIEEELEKRRYSEALIKYLLDPDGFEGVYKKVERGLNWKEMRSRRKYYTYVLVDPRSGDGPEPTGFEAFIRGVFYIGKGCGNRCAVHFFKEEPQGKCQVCKKEGVSLEDSMKTIAHKCCKSPTFNSISVCKKCGAKRNGEEDPHFCLGSGRYPEETTCPDCQKNRKVKDGKFVSHDVDSKYCKATNHLPKIGKCEDCNQDQLVLEDRKIRDHDCYKSHRNPEKVKCIKCEEMIEWKEGKNHRCCKVPEDCKQGTCRHCEKLFDLVGGKIKGHKCQGSRIPRNVKCIICEEKIKWKPRKNKHKCCQVPKDCKHGTCQNCKELFDLDRGKIKGHKCSGSGIPEKGVCKVCKKPIDLDVKEKIPAHQCCDSPQCLIKGECQNCNKLIPIKKMKIPAHQGCNSRPKYPIKGECPNCKKLLDLEEKKIPAHQCCDSPQDPIKGECKVCKKAIDLGVKKIPAHQRHDSPQYPKKGECQNCNELIPMENRKIPAHQGCDSRPEDPIKGECPNCKKLLDLEESGKIPAHQCCDSPQEPIKGVCIACGSLVKLSVKNSEFAVKGSTLQHKIQCQGSEKALEDVVNDIKDKKISSIWEEVNKTPTAVVCSQGDTDLQSRQKEAMMIMAYGKDNVSNTKRRTDNYVQGKLVNKRIETVSGQSSVDGLDLFLPKYGVSLLVDAWKTYKTERTNKDKPPCAARIMWPSNPKEVRTRDDDEDDSDASEED